MQRVVFLVHGTWGRGYFGFRETAPWAHWDSALVNTLTRNMPDLTVYAYSWSGRNTPRARSRAAARFQKFVGTFIDQHPDSQLYIIGHSHGGNVILKAVQDGGFGKKIKGIACLSTPFLGAEDRLAELREKRPESFVGAFVGLAFLLTVVTERIWRALIGNSSMSWLQLALTFVAFALVVGTGLVASRRYSKRIFDRVKYSVDPATNLLILHSAGDEARAVLGAFQFLGWIITRASGFAFNLPSRTSEWLSDLWINPLIASFAIAVPVVLFIEGPRGFFAHLVLAQREMEKRRSPLV